jgi:hypothetical protein
VGGREHDGLELVSVALLTRELLGRREPTFLDLGKLARVELVDDVDRFGCDPEGRHELVEGDEVFLRQSCPRDQNVELHPEEHLLLQGKSIGEIVGDRLEVLALSQGSNEKLSVKPAKTWINIGSMDSSVRGVSLRKKVRWMRSQNRRRLRESPDSFFFFFPEPPGSVAGSRRVEGAFAIVLVGETLYHRCSSWKPVIERKLSS